MGEVIACAVGYDGNGNTFLVLPPEQTIDSLVEGAVATNDRNGVAVRYIELHNVFHGIVDALGLVPLGLQAVLSSGFFNQTANVSALSRSGVVDYLNEFVLVFYMVELVDVYQVVFEILLCSLILLEYFSLSINL